MGSHVALNQPKLLNFQPFLIESLILGFNVFSIIIGTTLSREQTIVLEIKYVVHYSLFKIY